MRRGRWSACARSPVIFSNMVRPGTSRTPPRDDAPGFAARMRVHRGNHAGEPHKRTLYALYALYHSAAAPQNTNAGNTNGARPSFFWGGSARSKADDQNRCRGRDASRLAPPAQIRTSAIDAYGSYLGWVAAKRFGFPHALQTL